MWRAQQQSKTKKKGEWIGVFVDANYYNNICRWLHLIMCNQIQAHPLYSLNYKLWMNKNNTIERVVVGLQPKPIGGQHFCSAWIYAYEIHNHNFFSAIVPRARRFRHENRHFDWAEKRKFRKTKSQLKHWNCTQANNDDLFCRKMTT